MVGDRTAVAAALGLQAADLADELPVQEVSCGVPYLFVPVRDEQTLGRARINPGAWERSLSGWWTSSVFPFALTSGRNGVDLRARMFAPAMGMKEDPATGSAAIALAGVVNRFDELPEGLYEGIVEQGLEMGQPCEIFLEFEVENRQIRVVRIGGHALVMREGTIEA